MIKEVTFSMGQTLQLKQYEPTNLHYSARSEVGLLQRIHGKIKGEDAIQKEYDRLEKIVTTRLRNKMVEITKAQQKKEALKQKKIADKINGGEIEIIEEKPKY